MQDSLSSRSSRSAPRRPSIDRGPQSRPGRCGFGRIHSFRYQGALAKPYGQGRQCAWTIARPLQSEFYQAERSVTPVDPLTVIYPGLTVEQAYAIQLEGVAIQRKRDSRKVVGKKMV